MAFLLQFSAAKVDSEISRGKITVIKDKILPLHTLIPELLLELVSGYLALPT